MRVIVHDFNRDGIPDLVLSDMFNYVGVYYGTGDGITFGNPSLQNVAPGSNPRLRDMAIGDFNGDGTSDASSDTDRCCCWSVVQPQMPQAVSTTALV
jgi:hypothetical protein